jgi:hypothetical protein
MKKKIYILTVALIATAACIYASTPYLTVNYVTGEGPGSDYFSMEGGEIQILNDVVDIVFASDPGQDRTYNFDSIRSMQFVNVVSTVDEMTRFHARLITFVDHKAGLLHLKAKEPLGLIGIYSVAGNMITHINTENTEIDINIQNLYPGVYFVKKANDIVKFIK